MAVGLLLAGSAPAVPSLHAQAPPQYRAGQLGCAVFAETVRTRVRAEEAGVPWEESGVRDGVLVVRARAAGPALEIEAWYDSLAVTQDARSGRVSPDTDGLVGGRWQGLLTPGGAVELRARPFVPDDLRAVADLADALLDFFPPLPTAAIAAGETWTDSLGLAIRRLADSAGAARYRWSIRSRSAPAFAADTSVRLRQEAEDDGQVAWDASEGPLAWDRDVTVETRVVQSRWSGSHRGRVEQAIRVRRLRDHPACH